MSPERLLQLDPWLETLGFRNAAQREEALAALRDAGLLNSRPRTAIAESKARAFEVALLERFAIHCADADCQRLARAEAGGRRLLAVPASARGSCHVCRGSNTRRAFVRARAACAGAGLLRWLVVGGSPALREELREHLETAREFSIVMDPGGTDSRANRARAQRAEVIAILGGSQIHHKDTDLYTREFRAKVVQVRSRGLEGLFEEVERRARGGRE